MTLESFLLDAKKAADEIRNLDRTKPVRIISHMDADGLTAASIIIKALAREGFKFSFSTVKQLSSDNIHALAKENYHSIIFSDLGASQIPLISQLLENKKVFVFDHHKSKTLNGNLIHVNPHMHDIDGSKDISASGVSYQVVISLNKENKDSAHLAIIGAIGDVQDNGGFSEINQSILQTAVEENLISVERGIRFFGAETRPLTKILEYSTNPFIPGVTGSEKGTFEFLSELQIEAVGANGLRKLANLSDEEKTKLANGIVSRRSKESNPEDIHGNNYVLLNEEKGSVFRNAREFSTLLNACGRLGKTSLAIGTCIGDKKTKELSIRVLDDYKQEIITALKWFEKNKERAITEDGIMIINLGNDVMPTIAGTFASILARSGNIKPNTLLLSYAKSDNNQIKASMRVSGNKPRTDFNLRRILAEITTMIGGESGGHKNAAGALIPAEKENQFVDAAKRVMRKHFLEEKLTSS